jgi:hypothetical protein
MDKLNFVSASEAKQLEFQNYLFIKNRERNEKIYWSCINKNTIINGKKTANCKSTCITSGYDFLFRLIIMSLLRTMMIHESY